MTILEMKCLKSLAECHEWRELGMFAHVERIDEYHMARRVFWAEVSGRRIRGIPRLCKMGGMKVHGHSQDSDDGTAKAR